MAEPTRVVIGTQEVKLRLKELDGYAALQESIAELCLREIPEIIEKTFEEFHFIQNLIIPRLELDLGTFNPDQLESEFLSVFRQKIKEFASENLTFPSHTSVSETDNGIRFKPYLKDLLFFTRNGFFSWNMQGYFDRKEFLEKLKNEFTSQDQNNTLHFYGSEFSIILVDFRTSFSEWNKNEILRLYRFLGRAIFIRLYELLFPETLENEGISGSEKNNAINDVEFLEEIKKQQSLVVPAEDQYPVRDNNIEKRINSSERINNMDDLSDWNAGLDQALFTASAGVVILHPFIKSLFEKLGLLKENRIINPNPAVLALYFLVHNNRPAHEADLAFEKILCGLETSFFIDIKSKLPPGFKREKDSLLTSVIDHWKMLKTTSPAGLQKGFLIRKGKLTRSDEAYLLKVETFSHDILMAGLPWSVSMIKLPWMSNFLSVDWG